MGYFSWLTSDTQKSVAIEGSLKKTIKVKMIDDKGNEYLESNYEGYGVFDGMDFFVLTALMNGYEPKNNQGLELFKGYNLNIEDTKTIEKLRDIGLDLYFDNPKCKKPKIVTDKCKTPYKDLPDSKDCPNQGYFY
jgi:hypothetical protein